jgi:hypothetical protein
MFCPANEFAAAKAQSRPAPTQTSAHAGEHRTFLERASIASRTATRKGWLAPLAVRFLARPAVELDFMSEMGFPRALG